MTGKSQPMPSITRGTTATACDNPGTGMAVTVVIHEGGASVATAMTSMMPSARASWIAMAMASPATGTTESSPSPHRMRGGGGGAAGNDGNDNTVVEVDDEDANNICDNGAAVAEATANAAPDAKGGGMEVINMDDEDKDEDKDEVVDDVNAGDDGGNDGCIGVPTPDRGPVDAGGHMTEGGCGGGGGMTRHDRSLGNHDDRGPLN